MAELSGYHRYGVRVRLSDLIGQVVVTDGRRGLDWAISRGLV